MYEWGWRTFEGMFRRHLLRKAREELRQMRDLRIAALDANMNFDSQENQQAKQSRIEALQEAHESATRMLYSNPDEPVVDETLDDPLFSPIARQRLNESAQPLVEQAGMGRELLEASADAV
jgi:LPS O-antigen subunit length determinant protein (WzzB/FepE family)